MMFNILVIFLAIGAQAEDLHHITLPDSAVEGKRVIVFGDVHGCYDEMMEMLTKEDLVTADQQSIKDDAVVIFAGDIINKGPFNMEVLRFVMNSGAYVVYGNHERNILEKPEKYPWTSDLTADDIAWVESIPYSISIPHHGVQVVHAGLLPDTLLEDQTEFVMTRMRNIETRGDGTLIPHDTTDKGVNWASMYDGRHHVTYGHDAGRGRDENGNPIIQWWDKATGLDSRCVYGGKLSGIYLPIGSSPTVTQVQCEEYDSFDGDLNSDL